MEQPLLYWVPSIAPSGLDIMTGNRYPAWKGDLFAGSLSFGYLNRIQINEQGLIEGQEELLKGIGRVRNVRMGLDSLLYVAIEELGRIIRLLPVKEEPGELN